MSVWFLLGVALLGLLFVGVALARTGPAWVTVVMLWLGSWPVIAMGAAIGVANGILPGLDQIPKFALPPSLLVPGVSLLLGLAVTWSTGKIHVGLFSLSSVVLMFGALAIVGL